MSATTLDPLSNNSIKLPSGLLRKARASDQEGAREVLRALEQSGQDSKLTRDDRLQLAELLETLERETKILARVRDVDVHERDDFISPRVITRIFWFRRAWGRELRDFRRTSHNPYAQLRALVRHLFERYPTPRFLLNSFMEVNFYSGIYVAVARGRNIRQIARYRPLLTKGQAHLFHTMKDVGLSIRQAGLLAMARSHGVEESVAKALIRNRHVQAGHFPFWSSFMEFLSRQAEVRPRDIGTLCDYLNRHRVLPPARAGLPRRPFSFKGRTLDSLLARAEDWHRKLARLKRCLNRSWTPFADFCQFQRDANGFGWSIREILTERELHIEGSRMGHCVYDYLRDCLKRESGIYTLIEYSPAYPDGKRCLTIEVCKRKNARYQYEVEQARGKFNRDPTPEEDRALQAWAKANEILATDYTW